MKTKRMNLIAVALILLMIGMASFTYASTESKIEFDEKAVIQAAEPLIAANSKHAKVSNICIKHLYVREECEDYIDYGFVLHFDINRDELDLDESPYIRGMLDELGVKNHNIFKEKIKSGKLSILDRDVFSEVEGEIRETITQNKEIDEEDFDLIARFNKKGKLTDIWGISAAQTSLYDAEPFDLSIMMPMTDSELYESGKKEVRRIVREAKFRVGKERAIPLYHRYAARDYANRYTSNAQYYCVHGENEGALKDDSVYNPNYTTQGCHEDCTNYVSQAVYDGGIPRDSTWKPYRNAWVNAGSFIGYFLNTKSWVEASTFSDCNSGGLIFIANSNETYYYHASMCVMKPAVNTYRRLSAHTSDRYRYKYYSNYPNQAGRIGVYYVFKNTTTS